MRKSRLLALSLLLLLIALACQALAPQASRTVIPTLQQSPLDLGRTVYGFFPSPPEVSLPECDGYL